MPPLQPPAPGQKIDLCYARQLVMNFRDGQLASGTIRTDDTQAVWFSRETVLDALNSDDGVTGIRIYIGSYKSEPNFPPNAFDQDKLTLVLVPTGPGSIAIDRDGIIESAYTDIIDDPTPGKTQPAYPKSTGPGNDGIYNDGQMLPPPPPPGSIADLGLFDW